MKFQAFLKSSVLLSAFSLVPTAYAADLPSRKSAPMIVAAPLFTWTGFYVGASSSTAAGRVTSQRDFAGVIGPSSPFSQSIVSTLPFGDVFLGLQAGYNHQFASGVVVGIETDWQYGLLRKRANVAYSDQFFGPGAAFFQNDLVGNARFGLNWFGSTRLRLGYAVTPRFLPYLTGGVAYASIAGSTNWATDALGFGVTSVVNGSGASTRLGWTLGAGFEYAVGPNLTFKTEYLYSQYGGSSYALPTAENPTTGPSGSGPVASRAFGAHVLRSGLNWKFGGNGGAVSNEGPFGMFMFATGPVRDWSGFYFGLNGGYGGGMVDSALTSVQQLVGGTTEALSIRSQLGMTGFAFGGQAGYNWQFANRILAGVEADVGWSGVKLRGNATYGDSQPGFQQSFSGSLRYGQDWAGSARVRLGYAMSNGVMSYVTGGLAFANISGALNWTTAFTGAPVFAATSAAGSAFRLGWTLGAGSEYAINERLTVKGEYLYSQFSSPSLGGGGTLTNTPNGPLLQRATVRDLGISLARVGFNWRLGSDVSAPVVAKY